MQFRLVALFVWLVSIVVFVDASAAQSKVIPPPMPKRAVPPMDPPPPGERIEIADGDCKTLLFVPKGYSLPPDGSVRLTIHFHTTEKYIVGEHLRRGMKEPLLVAHLGEGSSTYGRPFQDIDRFGRLLDRVEESLSTTQTKAKITQVDITSFSAGYGAVREILKQDKYIQRIRRVILADSLYASWDPATTQPGATSRPAQENMEPFAKFLQMAALGEKTFVLTHSQVPTPYANTAATAKWIAELVGAQKIPIANGSLPATTDPQFPLEYRMNKGRLHIWGYGGTDMHAHLTHVRHIADIWTALDEAAED
jgi:hypothetical protein